MCFLVQSTELNSIVIIRLYRVWAYWQVPMAAVLLRSLPNMRTYGKPDYCLIYHFRDCEIIQDVYAACIYWIRCQWLFILVYNSTSYCNILLSFGAAKFHRQFSSCEFKMIHITDFAASRLHDVTIRYLTEYWKLWNTCIIFHFLVLQNQWTEPGSWQVDSLEDFCGAILSPW